MHSSPLFAAILCGVLVSCQTERSVIYGPTVTKLDSQDHASDYGEGIAGRGFSQRFRGPDPMGYQDNASGGLNAMSAKMFNKDLSEKSVKNFTQTKDFLTRRYLGTKENNADDSRSGRFRSWFANNKNVPAAADATETGRKFNASEKRVEGSVSREQNVANRAESRTAFGTDSNARESGRKARTRDFEPAAKALSDGSDTPDMINAPKGQADAVSAFVKSRGRENPATVEDIRSMLGK